MPSEPLILTREVLYERVWSEPIIYVAKRVGLSGRGLGKVCARHNIPVPPRGWWAKKQHGHRVRQSLLPRSMDPRLETIVLHTQSLERELTYADAPEYRREKALEWRIEVPEDLRISHPLVRAAQVAIRRVCREGRRDRPVHWNERYQAKLLKPEPGHLDIAVSKPLVPRALRIMQALLAALKKRGYAVSVTAKNETIVTVLDESMQIALIERFKQVVVKRTYSTGMDLEPSGRLRLRVGGSYSNSGVEDNPPRLIESSLNHFVAGLVRRALEAKRERAIREERERRWRIHDDDRRQRQQERESERVRLRRLRALAARWARNQRAAQFVATVEQRISDEPLDLQQQEVARRWVDWAKKHLQENDTVNAFLNEPWPSAPMPAPKGVPWNWE